MKKLLNFLKLDNEHPTGLVSVGINSAKKIPHKKVKKTINNSKTIKNSDIYHYQAFHNFLK